MEKIRFIFDLDGTIIDSDYSNEKEYFKSILSEKDSKKFIYKLPILLEKYERTHKKYTNGDIKAFFIKETGIEFTDSMLKGWYDSLIPNNYKEIDGIREVLEYLKNKGKSIVVLSNWITEVQLERLRKADLAKYFDEIYGGDVILKPRRDAYMLACGKYATENSIMIGDNLDLDVLGPNLYGIDSLFYDTKNTEVNKVKVKSINDMRKIKEMF